jgi:hypothetical protein
MIAYMFITFSERNVAPVVSSSSAALSNLAANSRAWLAVIWSIPSVILGALWTTRTTCGSLPTMDVFQILIRVPSTTWAQSRCRLLTAAPLLSGSRP